MSKRIYSLVLLGIIVGSLLLVTLPLLTIVEATIIGRPKVYYLDTYTDPLEVPAGASVSIDLSGMTITGAQVWLWISKTGGAAIEPGDRFIVGPFYMGDVVGAAPKTYVFVPGVNLTSPWSYEGRNYVFTVGNNWINGTMPLLVEGDVHYWLKITDVDPRLGTATPPSEVAVSENRIVFTPVFTATPGSDSLLAPGTPVTIRGYALPLTEKYNITQDTQEVATLLSPEKRTIDGWDYVTLEPDPFPLLDLKRKHPDPTGIITVRVIANSTGAIKATFIYYQPPRKVYLPSDGDTQLREHSGDYTTEVLETGKHYNVTLNWFPYMGSVNIYLNTTLVASGVALNGTGGVYNYTIRIPNLQSGEYYFRVIDNHGVEYNFTVYVKMAPYIEVVPTEGYVGDEITVLGFNFLDYVGQYITIYFETCPPGEYKLVANFTVPASEWSYKITVPVAPGGGRAVQVRDISGTNTITATVFTVLPKIVIDPAIIPSNYTGFINVIGLGFDAWGIYRFTVDNAFLGYVFCGVCGNFTVTLLNGGFRPGLHVVAVYDLWDISYALYAYKHFTVTEEGDIIAGKLDALNAMLVEIRDGIAVINTTVGEIKVKLDELNATIVGLIIDSKGEILAAIDTAFGIVLARLDAIEAMIIGVADDVVYIKTSVGVIEAKVDTVIDLIENSVIVKIEDGVATILTEIGEVRADLATLLELVQAVNATLVGVKDDVAVIKTDVATINIKLDELAPLVVEIRDGVVRLETAIGEVKTDLETIKSLVEASRDAVISEIRDGVATIVTDTGVIKAKVDALNATIVEVRGDVVTIKTDVGTVKSDVATIKPTVAAISYDIATIKTELGEITGKLMAIDGTLVVVETNVGTILASIRDVIVPGLSDIKSVVDAIRGDLSATKSDVGAVKATTSDIRDAVATIKSDVADVKSGVEPVPTLSAAVWLAVVFSLIAAILSAVIAVSVRRKIAG